MSKKKYRQSKREEEEEKKKEKRVEQKDIIIRHAHGAKTRGIWGQEGGKRERERERGGIRSAQCEN